MSPQSSSLQKVLTSRFYIGQQIPTSGTELAARLTEALTEIVGSSSQVTSVKATIGNPPNIDLIEADLSGLSLAVGDQAASAAKGQISSDVANEADRLPATIRKVMIEAHPVQVDGIPANFDLQVENVPFNWVTDRDGKVWFGVDSREAPDLTGELSGHMTKVALREGVRKAAATAAEAQGFHLLDLDFDLRQVGQDFFALGNAKLRKGILSAKAELRGVVHYDPSTLQITVKELQIHSSNPAVAMILRMAEGKIAQYRGKTIDLNKRISSSGYQLRQLDISVDADQIRFHGKF